MLENKNQSRTSLSELGEFKLIEHLTNQVKIHHKSTVKGIGDVSLEKSFQFIKNFEKNNQNLFTF